MTDEELRKLSRKDLLELLITQGRERDALQTELEQVKTALTNRQLQIEQAGSIADASLQLNGVFEAAQAAAQQYLENIRQRSEQIEAVCAKREAACAKREAACAQLETETQRKVDQQLKEAARAAQEMEAETRRKCQALETEAKEKAEAYWLEVSTRLKKLYQEYGELKALFSSGGKD